MTSPNGTQLEALQDELDGVLLYRGLSEAEKDPKVAAVYARMAQMEQRHADTLTEQLRQAGAAIPTHRPSFRTRTLLRLAKRFGVNAVLPSVMTLEQAAIHDRQQSGAPGMAADERSHARVLGYLVGTSTGGLSGSAIAQIEGRHRSAGGNALRAAVLGANDGLVSNLSLVMGVAGASMSNNAILVTGMAGLLAGACSMALGEWLSVQSSRELVKRQLEIERTEIATAGITLFTRRSVLFSGTRQVVFGMAAAAITFAIGRLIGVSIAG